MKGLKAVIIGGTSGIGLAIARHLSQEGCHVTVTGRDSTKMNKVVAELGNRVTGLLGDISICEGREYLVDQIRSSHDGSLDFLIISAALYDTRPLIEETDASTLEMFQTNVFSGLFFAREFYQLLREGKGKSVLFISSTLSEKPVAGTSAYAASKAAMDSLVTSMALEWAGEGIRVNSIQPGVVNTPIHDQKHESELTRQDKMAQFAGFHPIGRVGEVEDVARVALFLLAPASSWITGVKWPVDGGISIV